MWWPTRCQRRLCAPILLAGWSWRRRRTYQARAAAAVIRVLGQSVSSARPVSRFVLDYQSALGEVLRGANMGRVYNVQARWDSEGGVWVAESDHVPGLVAEAESPNVLAKKLRVLIPELLELNGGLEVGGEPIEFIVRYEHQETGVAALTS